MGNIVLNAVSEILRYALAVIIPAVGLLAGRLLLKLINKINNDTLRGLAIQAVLFAEDKLGPDTDTGKEKMRLAAEYLAEKTKISYEQAEALVRSAYQNVFAPFQPAPTS